MSTLSIEGLRVSFGRRAPVVEGIDLRLNPGERLGLVGESGSGKTVTSLAVMGLLPETARVTGSILLGEDELVGRSDASMSRLRGDRLSMIFQEPMTALDPTMTACRSPRPSACTATRTLAAPGRPCWTCSPRWALPIPSVLPTATPISSQGGSGSGS